eukprot:CAMPEP_0172746622 /NCGR_PEP_ID=MMETSP1074-20121228/141103_1 /TAXON_ID=2916 /ORGANISM="Ceratium fusus, Strain PA161109" /LENGTH=70 /DNA_ID=CAMNT_0013578013 /DNA_START=9 /DNA_END=218 /DNA_ORIENTATION=-
MAVTLALASGLLAAVAAITTVMVPSAFVISNPSRGVVLGMTHRVSDTRQPNVGSSIVLGSLVASMMVATG